MNKKTITIINILIYFLIIILAVLIAYSLIIQNKMNNNDIISVSNSMPSTNSNKYLSIKYSTSNFNDLSAIDTSDIVYEYYDKKLNKLKYEALFFNKAYISIDDTIESMSEEFIDRQWFTNSNNNLNINNNLLFESCDIIHINYSPDIFSSFVYAYGNYEYISSSNEASTSTHNFTNIIVQLVDSSNNFSDVKNIQGSSEGFLFNNGTVQSIKWIDSMLYSKDNHVISLLPGNTFWIICNSDNGPIYDNTNK